MTKAELAQAFSLGEFDKTSPFIADNAVWTIVEENTFIGKSAIINNCDHVSNYFKTVETEFKTLNVIEDKNKVVVNGTAAFMIDKQCISFVSACDIYEFDEQGSIEKIMSYCIQSKNENNILTR